MMRLIYVFMGLMMRVYRWRMMFEVDIFLFGLENNVVYVKISICFEDIYIV